MVEGLELLVLAFFFFVDLKDIECLHPRFSLRTLPIITLQFRFLFALPISVLSPTLLLIIIMCNSIILIDFAWSSYFTLIVSFSLRPLVRCFSYLGLIQFILIWWMLIIIEWVLCLFVELGTELGDCVNVAGDVYPWAFLAIGLNFL